MATIFQSEQNICVRFHPPRNKRNEPTYMFDHRFISAPSQRIILALINKYTTERLLTDASPYLPYYATMTITFQMSRCLQTIIEEVDENQSLFAGTTLKAVRKLVRNVTIEAVRSFLALQKLLADEKTKRM